MKRAAAAFIVGLGALACFAAAAGSEDVTREYYEVNGAKLYIESLGHGTPVLFLHGGLMFFDNAYVRQRDFFAARHLVIGIDQRGHGHSPDGPWQLSYQLMADDTAAIIQKLKIGPVDVVGHSDGADIALLLARIIRSSCAAWSSRARIYAARLPKCWKRANAGRRRRSRKKLKALPLLCRPISVPITAQSGRTVPIIGWPW